MKTDFAYIDDAVSEVCERAKAQTDNVGELAIPRGELETERRVMHG